MIDDNDEVAAAAASLIQQQQEEADEVSWRWREQVEHDNDNDDDDEFEFDNSISHDESEEAKSDEQQDASASSSSSSSNSSSLIQLLNLPELSGTIGNGIPVGGMRRVSSCYFSIASNNNNNNNNEDGMNSDYFADCADCDLVVTSSVNAGAGNSIDAIWNDALLDRNEEAESANATNLTTSQNALQINATTTTTTTTAAITTALFHHHDILMNILSYLNASSLASFSEINKKLNFESFYFLELQLQRALLVGTTAAPHSHAHYSQQQKLHQNLPQPIQQLSSQRRQQQQQQQHPPHHAEDLPFITGTGVISRLASMDSTKARHIVQTCYLDSNSTIRGMPLSHSLAYLRQVLRQHSSQIGFVPRYNNNNNTTTNGLDNSNAMVKNARNMALLLTFLGAAYMHNQSAGGGAGVGVGDATNLGVDYPDPGEVIQDLMNSESVAALRDAILKVGLAGGLVKAGATMKERQQQQQQQQQNSNSRGEVDHGNRGVSRREGGDDATAADNNNDGDDDGVDAHLIMNDANDNANLDGEMVDANANENENLNNNNNTTTITSSLSSSSLPSPRSAAPATATSTTPTEDEGRRSNRSSSLGSLEDLSSMLPTAIATRLYKAFSHGNSYAGIAMRAEQEEESKTNESMSQTNTSLSGGSGRRHRNKRSHYAIRRSPLAMEDQKEDSYDDDQEATILEETKSSLYDDRDDDDQQRNYSDTPNQIQQQQQQNNNPSPEAMAYAMDHPFSPNPYDHLSVTPNTMNKQAFAASHTDNKAPSGCIGAYAHTVKSAAAEVTRLIKEERQANFDALPEEERIQLGIRFIDACSSDDKLPIVKEILQEQKMIDVDRFFIGTDETETCALHAAAFNGAEQVLEFLCGGIDERDSTMDGGLCNVDIRDANGWTALHFAAGANSVSSVRILAEHGAKLTIEAGNGYTPFHWAERLSNEEVAVELERLGADNRFVGGWMFGGGSVSERKMPFVSFFANRFFAFSR